jgi:uncharacterized DUF497 family protein
VGRFQETRQGNSGRRDFVIGLECGEYVIHIVIQYTRSAFKHGIGEADIHHAFLNPVYDEIQDSGDDKHLLLGFDRSMNILEIAYNIIDEQTFKVFHAMKCRNSYYELLRR